jgi:hypothetical protein
MTEAIRFLSVVGMILLVAGCSAELSVRDESQIVQTKSAEEAYRRAERNYTSGDFERSLADCGEALGIEPRHAAAKSLQTELHFITGARLYGAFPLGTTLRQMEGMLRLGHWYFLYGYSYLAQDQANGVMNLAGHVSSDLNIRILVSQARELLTWIQAERERTIFGITDD